MSVCSCQCALPVHKIWVFLRPPSSCAFLFPLPVRFSTPPLICIWQINGVLKLSQCGCSLKWWIQGDDDCAPPHPHALKSFENTSVQLGFRRKNTPRSKNSYEVTKCLNSQPNNSTLSTTAYPMFLFTECHCTVCTIQLLLCPSDNLDRHSECWVGCILSEEFGHSLYITIHRVSW